MKRIGRFLKNFFTKNVPVKLLALALAVVTVLLININI